MLTVGTAESSNRRIDKPLPDKPQPRQRIEAIDIARGVALLAMAIYHFAWDLEFFGYAHPGLTAVGGWKLFARSIASSFLFLAGVSLFLAHADGIRWRGYWRRFAMVAGAALAITVATRIATPQGFIFFGILHHIAVASLLGLAFLRLPAVVTLLAACLVAAAPHLLSSPVFDDPWWWWTGLSETRPRSNDYVPVFPWFAAVLAGIAAAGFARRAGLLARLAALPAAAWTRPAAFAGRHSLAFYLLHQPVLIACVWIFAQIAPPPPVSPELQFSRSCEAACEDTRDSAFCTRYCGCMIDRLQSEGTFDSLMAGEENPALRRGVEATADFCTVDTDNAMLEGEQQ